MDLDDKAKVLMHCSNCADVESCSRYSHAPAFRLNTASFIVELLLKTTIGNSEHALLRLNNTASLYCVKSNEHHWI